MIVQRHFEHGHRRRVSTSRHSARACRRTLRRPITAKRRLLVAVIAGAHMIRHARRLALGSGVQSIEHDRRARRDSHQIRSRLPKPLPDTRRTLRERRVKTGAKRRNRCLGSAVKIAIESRGECRGPAATPLGCSRLSALADGRICRLAAGPQPERLRYSRSEIRQRCLPDPVLSNVRLGTARRLRRRRSDSLRNRRHFWFCRKTYYEFRLSVEPLLGVLRRSLFASLEYVVNRRRGAAVSLGNFADRLALCITCRNGAPFALRNF